MTRLGDWSPRDIADTYAAGSEVEPERQNEVPPFEPYEYFVGSDEVGYFCHVCCKHGELPAGTSWADVDAAAEAHLREKHGAS